MWTLTDIIRLIMEFLAVLLVLLGLGCSVNSWDAEATEGEHRTTWNHGFVIQTTGWGIYIGPGENSVTTIENEFTAKAEGEETENKDGE